MMKDSPGQFYAPYWEWEDFQNGMYKSTKNGDLSIGKRMFIYPSICAYAMRKVIKDWPIATKVNLTNLHSNRRAWLGQAACCLYADLTQEETCAIWKELSDSERDEANRIANLVIKEWEDEYRSEN